MTTLLFIGAALAADDEISVELGWIGAHDRAWDVFSRGDSYGTVGLRVGKEVHDRVAIVAGWQHGTVGADVESDDDGDDYDYDTGDTGLSSGSFRAAFYGNQLTLGAKADVELLPWLHPYATVQGVGVVAVVRFDDDLDDDENATQVQRTGFSGGLLAAGGVDFPIRVKGDVAIAPYLELGYGFVAPIRFDELGEVGFGGFAGRTGVGVRF
ncbi:MAG: hypothetical protein ACOZNI_13800 [Myxococcota bacterium]